jgi:hypothetical protein
MSWTTALLRRLFDGRNRSIDFVTVSPRGVCPCVRTTPDGRCPYIDLCAERRVPSAGPVAHRAGATLLEPHTSGPGTERHGNRAPAQDAPPVVGRTSIGQVQRPTPGMQQAGPVVRARGSAVPAR